MTASEASLFERQVSVRAVAVLRILVGPIVIGHLWTFLRDAVPGRYFGERFYIPFFEGWPVFDVGTYRLLVIIALLGAVTMSLGFLTRLSCAVVLSFVTFNVLSNQLFFHHNRAFLITVLFGLTVMRSGATLSVDAWLARRRGRPVRDATPFWQLLMVRGLACTPYLASGFSKLIDPDWFGGVVMYDRVLRYRHVAEARGVPAWLIDPIANPGFHAVFWKIIVLTELFIGVGYWFPRTRVAAMFMAIGFHLIIEITSTVSVFSYLGMAATLLWVVPETRDRVVRIPAGWRKWKRMVRLLDWLGRFRIEEGTRFQVVDRDGRVLEGPSARRLVLSRLPLFMPFVAPLLLLDRR